jgi:hypothetical protein
MKRQRPPAHEDWRAVRDRRGSWTIVDATGSNPLLSPDPLRRLIAVHVAAQAPRLQAAVAWLLHDLHAQEDYRRKCTACREHGNFLKRQARARGGR